MSRSVSVVTSSVVAASLFALAACGPPRSPRTLPAMERVERGYGSQWRDDVSSGVTSLREEELSSQRVGSVEQLLQDRVAGVVVTRSPDGSMSVRVRGTRSIVGSNEPLVVIDGLPVNAPTASLALSGVAPQNVIRIDVLKDAGATAAYGSRGANGVILVTTRGAPIR